MSSNLPEGKQAVLLTREQIQFLISNAESNETFATNQLLAWATLEPKLLEDVKDSFLKLDALKNQFREIRFALEAQLDG